MLLPSGLCDGGNSHRANSSTSSLHSAYSPAPGHSRRPTTSSRSRLPHSHTQPTLAPPAITVSAVSPSNDRPSAAEGHISSLFASVRPGVSGTARAAGILSTCKRLHQILSLDSTSRIANGGVLGCASGLTPQPSVERDVQMARTPSPALRVPAAAQLSTPKRRRGAAGSASSSNSKANAKAKAKATRSTSVQTIRTVSSSSLKVIVATTEAPSTPKRPHVVRMPKTPLRRNKRRRSIGGSGASNDEDDKFYTIPVQGNILFNRNYAINPSTPHKRTKMTISENKGPIELVFGPLIGGGERASEVRAVPRPTRRRAMTTSSHNISRPMQASRVYNQRTQAQDGLSGAYINRPVHSRAKSLADASTLARHSEATQRRPNLLPPGELTKADVAAPPIPPHYLLSPNTHALSNLSLNSPQAAPRDQDPDAMDMSPSTTSPIDTNDSPGPQWSHQEDRQLVEIVLQKLQPTHEDLEACAKSLGKDAEIVEARWEKVVKKLAQSGKPNAAPAGTPATGNGVKSSAGLASSGVNTPNGRKMLRRTTKRIEERRMSTPSREGSFKENI